MIIVNTITDIKFIIIFLFEGDKDDDVNEVNNDENVDEKESTSERGLVEEEEKDVGVVKYDVYRSYWRAAGTCLTVSILLSLFLMQGKLVVFELHVQPGD